LPHWWSWGMFRTPLVASLSVTSRPISMPDWLCVLGAHCALQCLEDNCC
jgi:hypothetical protein